MEVNWLPDEVWNLRSSLLYDTSDNQFDAASIQLGSNPAKVVFSTWATPCANPALLLNRPVTEQANFSAYYPSTTTGVYSAIEYSLEADQAVEDMVGFEYDNCCWQMRLLYMRYIDTAGGFIPISATRPRSGKCL